MVDFVPIMKWTQARQERHRIQRSDIFMPSAAPNMVPSVFPDTAWGPQASSQEQEAMALL